MRFCLLETSCEQEDNFPPNIAVKINDKMCPLPSPIPTNKPGVEPKRPSRPVNITALCRISPTVTNRVQVSWASEYGRCYVISVYLVQKLSSDDLLHRLKSKGVRIADFTRSLIKQKLNEDADCEIATTSLRCSLMCPLGKMRMLLPCRANTCNHLQCFDASLYLQMNERKPTWTCPVCDKPAIYDTLVIDGYFQEVLSLNTTSNEVTLHKDGMWTPLVPKKDRPEPQAEKRKSIVAIETLSDSDDDTGPPPASASGAAAPSKVVFDDSVVEEVPSNGGDPSAKKKSSSNVEIITLETSNGAKSDDSWSVGTVDPGKRLIFRKSMTCEYCLSTACVCCVNALHEYSEYCMSALHEYCSTNGTSGSGPSCGDLCLVAASASTSPSVVSSPTHSTAAVDLRGVEESALVPPQALNSDTSPPASTDTPQEVSSEVSVPPHRDENSALDSNTHETHELQQTPRPTRTSNRATRFQGITWEGDSDTSTDDDFDEDATRDDGAGRRGRKRGRSSSGGRSRTTSASSSASATGTVDSVPLASAPSVSPL
ncbi:Zinc finger MIZ-type [Trinorchestia longiramus]|nr:Zinc finger MIZ-type [Trinorchestia longiramus]